MSMIDFDNINLDTFSYSHAPTSDFLLTSVFKGFVSLMSALFNLIASIFTEQKGRATCTAGKVQPVEKERSIQELVSIRETLTKIAALLKEHPDLDLSQNTTQAREFFRLTGSLPSYMKSDFSSYLLSGGKFKRATSFFDKHVAQIDKQLQAKDPTLFDKWKLVQLLEKIPQFLIEENPYHKEIKVLSEKLPDSLRNLTAFKDAENCGKLAQLIKKFLIAPEELIKLLETFPNIDVGDAPHSNIITSLLAQLPKELQELDTFKKENNCEKLANLIKSFYIIQSEGFTPEYIATRTAQSTFGAVLQSAVGAEFVVNTLPPIKDFKFGDVDNTFEIIFASDSVGAIGEVEEYGVPMAEGSHLHVSKVLKGKIDFDKEEITLERGGFVAKRTIGSLDLIKLSRGKEPDSIQFTGIGITGIGFFSKDLGECRQTYVQHELRDTFINLVWKSVQQ